MRVCYFMLAWTMFFAALSAKSHFVGGLFMVSGIIFTLELWEYSRELARERRAKKQGGQVEW